MTMNVARLRRKTGLNQHDFYSRIGITQSAGSRYENGGRRIPRPVRTLLDLAYGTDRKAQAALKKLRTK